MSYYRIEGLDSKYFIQDEEKLKKYDQNAYWILHRDILPELRLGKFIGKENKNSNDKILVFDLEIPSRTFKKVSITYYVHLDDYLIKIFPAKISFRYF